MCNCRLLLCCTTKDYTKKHAHGIIKPKGEFTGIISKSQGGNGFEDLFGQPLSKMEEVVGTIILGLIKQQDSMFNDFLQQLENSGREDLAKKLREYINKY